MIKLKNKMINNKIADFRQNDKGITMIALIITILITVILAAVVILIVTNKDIIRIASDKTTQFAQEQEKEMDEANNADNRINDVLNKLVGKENQTSLVKEVNCIAIQNDTISINVDLDIQIKIDDVQNLIGYIIFVNDNFYMYTDEEKVTLTDKDSNNIVNKITVLAVDKNYNTISTTVYPERTQKRFLYINGEKTESWTRAWLDTIDVSWQNNSIRYYANAEKPGVGYRTTNKIDFEEYTKICFYYNGYKTNSKANVGSFGYSKTALSAYNYPTKAGFVGRVIPYEKYNGVLEKEINSTDNDCFVCFELYGWVDINIYGIWLEK